MLKKYPTLCATQTILTRQEVARYGLVSRTGTSLVGSKPWHHFFTKK